MVPIMLEDQQVGFGEITGQGLYRKVYCRCAFSTEGIYKVLMHCGGKIINLGTLYPVNGEFVLNKTISARNIGEEEIGLTIQPPMEGKLFVPIRADREFAFLSNIPSKKLVFENGIPGIHLTDSEV